MPLTELLGGAIAVVLIGLASAAILAWTVRSRASDRVLLLFGVWCGLYGVRLISEQPVITSALGGSASSWSYLRAFITYLINVPIGLFLEALIGPGWKMSVRRVWQIEAIYAAIAIAGEIVLRTPRAMMGLNSPLVMAGVALGLVNVWMFRDRLQETFTGPAVAAAAGVMALAVLNENLGRPLVPGLNLEPLGVLAFVAALGHGVVSRAVRRETELVAVQRELETARQIQSRLLPRSVPLVDGLDVAARYVPMSAVAGDFYDFVMPGRSQVGIMVADVSGHGVPAALVASMVKLAFSTQAEQADDPAVVLAAMNRILCRNAEGTFVTAVYAVIDTQAGTMTVANAGHPSLLIGRARGTVDEVSERG
ncbi:MAG TPA: SpoIIE family protein phosphatase, partial [Vicinamibacterales bacterium]|nr:SpoIIE family protein phosphatase [Vicinamibacterales bacterium]